jgi:hypothetical protein
VSYADQEDDLADVTDRDVTDALRLAREYVYHGAEPYAPAVMHYARMLAAHRREIEAELRGAR